MGAKLLRKSADSGSLFVVLETEMQAYQAELSVAFPWVRITNPLYAEEWLREEASTWGTEAGMPPEQP